MFLHYSNFKVVLLLLWLLFFSNDFVLGQNKRSLTEGIKLRCELGNSAILDNKDLKAKVILTNISDRPILIYGELVEGFFNNILGDNKVNFELIVQHKVTGKFRNYSNKVFIDLSPEIDSIDNLLKIKVGHKDSVINYFHVDSRYKFDVGDYRMKCLYWNNIHVNKNIESNWVYFRVINPIYVKHYFENEHLSSDTIKVIQ